MKRVVTSGIIQLTKIEINMKTLYYNIRKIIVMFMLVKSKHTTVNGNLWKVYIRKPSVEKLHRMGFKNENRGFRMKSKKQLSIHVLPTGEGWQIHIDRSSKGKHTVSKTHYTEVHINKFFKNYPII